MTKKRVRTHSMILSVITYLLLNIAAVSYGSYKVKQAGHIITFFAILETILTLITFVLLISFGKKDFKEFSKRENFHPRPLSFRIIRNNLNLSYIVLLVLYGCLYAATIRVVSSFFLHFFDEKGENAWRQIEQEDREREEKWEELCPTWKESFKAAMKEKKGEGK